MWMIERNSSLKSDQVQGTYEYLASVHRTLFLYGPVFGLPQRMDAFNASSLADTILAMGKFDSSRPIKLVLDSEGGSVRDGLVLYDAIKMSPCEVWTFGRMCYSMAAVLLSAGTKGRRYLYPNSHIMLHLPSGSTQGDVESVKIYTDELKKTKDVLVDRLIENGVRHKKAKIMRDINREYFMTANQAIDYGIADKIASQNELY